MDYSLYTHTCRLVPPPHRLEQLIPSSLHSDTHHRHSVLAVIHTDIPISSNQPRLALEQHSVDTCTHWCCPLTFSFSLSKCIHTILSCALTCGLLHLCISFNIKRQSLLYTHVGQASLKMVCLIPKFFCFPFLSEKLKANSNWINLKAITLIHASGLICQPKQRDAELSLPMSPFCGPFLTNKIIFCAPL